MAHAIVLSSTLQKWTGGDNGLTGLPSPTMLGARMQDMSVFYLASGFLIVGFVLARVIRRSPFGLMLRSIKENPMRLEYTGVNRSEEHTSELQSLMRISYAVFCLQKKTKHELITIREHRTITP